MKSILVAIDSFKGCLSSKILTEEISTLINSYDPNLLVHKFYLADGGEGSLELILSHNSNLQKITLTTYDAIKQERESYFLYDQDKHIAWIEVATTIGLPLVPLEFRKPLITTSYGVGQQILKAIELGAKKINIFLGGTATIDGGLGMLDALSQVGNKPILEGQSLVSFGSGSFSMIKDRIKDLSFVGLCDVNNPLLGPNGAVRVFGPQKGATEYAMAILEDGMKHYANIAGKKYIKYPGAGAAGGIGFAILWALNGTLSSGSRALLEMQHISDLIKDVDLVITGEGSIDEQTLMGKGPGYIAQCAKALGIPVIGLCGRTSFNLKQLKESPFSAIFTGINEPQREMDLIQPENTIERLKFAIHQIFNLYEMWHK